jgi:SAM-dependent methyltransferase
MPATTYGDDLAYIHDVGYDFHARGMASALLKRLDRAGLAGSVVVDLGCGSGIWANELHEHGYRPVGVDLSPAMIALARRRCPKGEFHTASFLDFQFPRCGAITALGEPLSYLFDEHNSRRALARLFQKAFDALPAGGLFIFDIVEVGLDRNRPPTFRAGDDWACLVTFEYDKRRDQLVRHITTFRRVGQLYRRGEETHRVQLYDRRDIAGLLRHCGFRVRSSRRLGEYQMLPGRVLFIARKP